jgi:hypothetical protein
MFVRRKNIVKNKYIGVTAAMVMMYIFLYTMHAIYKDLPTKIKKMFRHSGVEFVGGKKHSYSVG